VEGGKNPDDSRLAEAVTAAALGIQSPTDEGIEKLSEQLVLVHR
jgi:hypothetical protein